MLPVIERDLWETLSRTDKTILLYGMGNGGDKVLAACAEKGIAVRGVFASDGFARGNLFHGMPVRTWGEMKEQYGAENVIVLLAFGSSRPEVLETILRIGAEAELYAPDVPAFGDGLFDRAFYEAHQEELEQTRALFSDEESRRLFDCILRFKLTGEIGQLLQARSDPEEVWSHILSPARIRSAADLGAYNGDTVRELMERTAGKADRILAMEPDPRNFAKLKAYAETQTAHTRIAVHNVAAWCSQSVLHFEKSGNRNASVGANRSQTLADRPARTVEVLADTLDHLLDGDAVDYIKYDVEGSEREALIGSLQTLATHTPDLLVSLYHRNEDLFTLPLWIHKQIPAYRGFYLRRFGGIPAWDINLYVTEKEYRM